MEADPEDVERGTEERRGHARREQRGGPVREHDVPQPVDDDPGIGIVAVEHALQRGPHPRHLVGVERGLGVPRCVPRREEQCVAFPQRHVELVGDREHELGARARSTRLDEAQVPRRDPDVEREVELTAPTPDPPVAQQRSDAAPGLRGRGHTRTLKARVQRDHYLAGSGATATGLVRRRWAGREAGITGHPTIGRCGLPLSGSGRSALVRVSRVD